jgi:proteasome accessory factor A
MRRDIPWDRIVAGVVPFLVTRQIYAGAGKMGGEGEGTAGQPGLYQVSQRSDFFSVLVSIDTMNRRPIVNTRDEPHADISRYRRFHIIIGDSNMSEIATALKIGATALVLELIEKDLVPKIELANPVEAAKSISRDQNYDWIIELRDGRKISAIDIQRIYLEAARQHCEPDPEVRWILDTWGEILNDLQRDVLTCVDRLDWVAKKYLLTTFRESEGIEWTDPWLQSIDLEYHNISLDHGLYYELIRAGQMRRFITEQEIKAAIFQPPETTRAFFRGRSVARFHEQIASIQWDEIVFKTPNGPRSVSLNRVFEDGALERVNNFIREASSFEDFHARLTKSEL